MTGLTRRTAHSFDPSGRTRSARPPPSVSSYSFVRGFAVKIARSVSLFVAMPDRQIAS